MGTLIRSALKLHVAQLHHKTAAMSHAWGYANSELPPDEWHKDYPVAKGKRQSPIDFNSADSKKQGFPDFNITYDETNLTTVSNNGHSVTFTASAGNSELSGGPLSSKYKLEQFHFHWGADSGQGSEHTVNGRSFAAELHLVHWNSEKYKSFTESLDHPDGLCVLGAFLEAGEENCDYGKLFAGVKLVPYKGDTKTVVEKFDPRILLPGDLSQYFHYPGSLTTPPLKECVQWVVFKDSVKLSENQLQDFRNLRIGGKDSPHLVDNYRPVQHTCCRDIFST